jgi:hypothetical protein
VAAAVAALEEKEATRQNSRAIVAWTGAGVPSLGVDDPKFPQTNRFEQGNLKLANLPKDPKNAKRTVTEMEMGQRRSATEPLVITAPPSLQFLKRPTAAQASPTLIASGKLT